MKIGSLNGWRIKPKLHGDAAYAKYVERMAAEQRKLNPPKPRPIKPDGMIEEDFQFSLQCKSTQAIITAQKDPDYQRDWTAPIPENYLANPNAKTVEEMVGTRSVSAEEMKSYGQLMERQSHSRNTLGQSELGSTRDAKNRAIDHFISHPGVPERLLSDEELIAIREITTGPKGIPASLPQYEWKKIPAWKALWMKLTGKQVRSERE